MNRDKSTTITYEYSVEEIKKIIIDQLSVAEDLDGDVSVNFIIQEVDADPMDRYPGRDEVTGVRIRVDKRG